ncbi:uncharacterized protein H6S33_006854 [Morchella sextelata]|uniref:uncharacterized protein n=1 Tax=Morchella sextelata TaxID=1174677 RepID=UPI001D044F20|nr:uncharacterized protein H6S33_006854 [Morchella sextelata]KAH0604477.1 hypothetical protein H6S33_006854 [Morchella sextelata]
MPHLSSSRNVSPHTCIYHPNTNNQPPTYPAGQNVAHTQSHISGILRPRWEDSLSTQCVPLRVTSLGVSYEVQGTGS